MRPISPEEYDAAAAARPWECINASAGDKRTGRQLLAAAAADRAPMLSLVCPLSLSSLLSLSCLTRLSPFRTLALSLS